MPATEAEQKKNYRLAIRRPVMTSMLFVVLLVFGWRSYQKLPVTLMPDITYPTLTVRTEYEGAAPEDVEKLVTRPIEEMLSIVSGLVEISSSSSPGVSEIVLEFTWDTDMNVAQQDVRDQLDLFVPPEDVTENPVILRYDPALDPVMRVAITPGGGPDDAPLTPGEERAALTAIRDAVERHLKGDLEAEKGIAQIEVKGGQEQEVQVLVDAERLKGLGLTLDSVVQALNQQNINYSGGRLREGKTEYLVRTVNEFASVEEIAECIIPGPGQQQFRLSDVAQVFMGAKERETVVRINGREAVAMDIFKEGDANTVAVCDTAKDLLGIHREPGWIEKLRVAYTQAMQGAGGPNPAAAPPGQPPSPPPAPPGQSLLDRLPGDIQLNLISDQSRFINGAIREVREAAVLGGVLALLVLFLFLRELRATVIVGVAIPISVVATFLPMYLGGISLNIMSLGGLALGVGMLVDNSIVVLESIFRCKEEGDEVTDAAERGASEVSSAVMASTFTTISVFLPIAFVEGVAGQLFGDLAMAVTFSLLASLLAALYLIPLIASRPPLALRAEREVVWMLRAYRQARHGEQRTRWAALARIAPLGIAEAWAASRAISAECLGPLARAAGGLRKRSGWKPSLVFLGMLLLSPVLAALFLLQLTLRASGALIASVLFTAFLAGYAIFWLLRRVLGLLFWLPLQLFDWGFEAFRGIYAAVLAFSLRFSAAGLLLVAGLAVHTGYTAMGLGRELIPPLKQGEFGIRLEARAGTRLADTEARARRVEALLEQAPEVDSVTVEIGGDGGASEYGQGENIALFTVLLENPKANAAHQDAIMDRLRREIGAAPGEEISYTLPSLFSFKTAVELQIAGEEASVLRRLGNQALEAMASVPGLADLELSMKPGYPEVIIELDRTLLADKGLTPSQVAYRLRTEVQGDVATQFNQGGEKVDIRVRTDQDLLSSVEDLRQLSVSDGAAPAPLSEVATIREREGPSEILRIGQQQVVLVTGNVVGRDLGAVSADIRQAVSAIPMPSGYGFFLGGQNRELQTSYASLRFALLLAVFLVYVVMACQFESIWHPALVMSSVPLAFVGVIYTLDWTGTDLSIMVFLGGIILAGIVVNDAIVLVDYINQLRARGFAKHEAIVRAGSVRLRPILMTTVTTVLGLLPMILSSGEGAELRRPMAITVMAGLTSATVLTLVIIPMVYYLFGGRDRPPAGGSPPPEKGAP